MSTQPANPTETPRDVSTKAIPPHHLAAISAIVATNGQIPAHHIALIAAAVQVTLSEEVQMVSIKTVGTGWAIEGRRVQFSSRPR